MLARTLPALVTCCVVACGSKSAPPTTPAGSTGSSEAGSGAPAGLDLSCEAPNVTFTVSGATLLPSTRPNHKTDGRWSEIAGTYKLVAGAVQNEGAYVGFRNTDYAFLMSQSKTTSTDEVPVVRLNGGGADGANFSLEWTTSASQQASTTVTCKGSLLTAPAPAPAAP
jgi:hypothetical protein